MAESQVNAAKQQLVWQVTVDQRATVLARAPLSAPSASASPGLPESLGEPSTGAQAAYFSASTTPASHPDALRVAEAIARVQRRILEDLIPIPDGMYEVRIDEIQGDGPGPEPSAGAVAASAASFPGGRSGTATQLRSSSASYTEGSKAASMRAARMLGGARGEGGMDGNGAFPLEPLSGCLRRGEQGEV